jgi:anti-sigma regulatory factor (Ser/Thr protein kinase)
MASTPVKLVSQLIGFVVPSSPESVRIARLHVQAALGFHGLGEYADDAAVITSELVTNAVQHVGGTETIGIVVARLWDPAAVAVVVSDSSAQGPIKRETSADSEHGRGLQVVDALSAQWGWHHEDGGKMIYAVLTREA